MSGETEKQPSGWTVDTALVYLEAQIHMMTRNLDERHVSQLKALDTAFNAAEKAISSALEAAEKGVSKAEQSAEKRFIAVNELHQALSAQAAAFPTRVEMDAVALAMHKRVDDHIGWAEDRMSEVGTRITHLGSRLDLMSGEDNGSAARDAKIFAVIAGMGGLFGILLSVFALFEIFK